MRKLLLLLISGLLFFAGIQCRLSEEARTVALYEQYCGNCHLAPNPAVLPKRLWREQVLPEMGARLGVPVGDYNPKRGLAMEEVFLIDRAGIYPREPLIPEADWKRIYDYVLSRAPDSLAVDSRRRSRSRPLEQFRVQTVSVDKMRGAQVTALHYDSLMQHWWVGYRSGEWYTWSVEAGSELVTQFSSAISGIVRSGGDSLILEMGYMDPSDLPKGKLWKFRDGTRSVILENLYRPVFVESFDLTENGETEYLICEFGNRIGMLSLLQQEGSTYKKRSLLQIPGMIRLQLADMNADGRKDMVALAGQGDEGIYLFYNQGKARFSLEHPIRLPPIYGSSWFELFDYDGDGDLDIALVNGDNADRTYALKPYHGLRLFLNDGRQHFTEAFFYPIYGATRLIARDFDQDGDMDFAVSALFPDFEHNPEESFVYLENQSPADFRFQAYTSPATLEGNWLVMESGDVDRDGDQDILLGSYLGSPAPVPDSLNRKWMRQNVDLLLLENQTIPTVVKGN